MNKPIPLVDLKAQYLRYKSEFDTALQRQIDSCGFVGGPTVEAFANEFAEYCGGGYVTTCGNGSDALEIALWALLGWGDRTRSVLIPSHTFIATAEAVTNVGYNPVFVDIDPRTYLMDMSAVEAAVRPDTCAVIPVHLYGQMVDISTLTAFAKSKNLIVLEDAAQAHGASFKGVRPGILGDAATFSFFPGKNLGAWGDGGAVFTKDELLAQRMTMFANHGRQDKYRHKFEGFSSRLDGIQAAILRAKLLHIEEWNKQRRQIATWYDEAFADIVEIQVPHRHPDALPVFHLYVVQVDSRIRDKVLAYLNSNGIGAGVHYPVPLHEQPAYAYLKYAPGDLPITSEIAKRIISLPIYPELNEAQVQRVREVLSDAIGSLRSDL